METTVTVLIMLLAVVVSAFLARATRLPVPLVQIALGAAVYALRLKPVALDPEVFFLLFLPPLLFLDGWRIPKDDLLRDVSTVLKLALGLVVFTVLGMGFFIHWLIPAMPLAVAFALAAVLSPTDPIAVSSIAARAPIPRRMMHILEGESLLNDASGLVSMRFAVAAALTGTFALSSALANFLWVALGGLAVGAAVVWVLARLRSWAAARFGADDNAGAQILVTLLIPFGAYQLAEHFQCSGILAAVAAGITMSFTELRQWQAAARIRRTAVWDTVQFAANGSIFVLLGEQMPSIATAAAVTVRDTGHGNPWWLALYVVVIVAALAALRFVWVVASLAASRFGARRRGAGARPSPNWRLLVAMSLAGVRGAVTLAGVLTLPLLMNDGTPFPARDLAIFLAAGVIVLSLVVATVALPRTLQGLQLPPDTARQFAEDRARKAAAEAAIRAIEARQQALVRSGEPGDAGAWLCSDIGGRLIELYRQRIERHAGDGTASPLREQADAVERQLRLAGLRAERDEILRLSRSHALDETTARKITREIDLQEARYGG